MLDRNRSRDRSKAGGAFSPARLFVTGAQGAWYDPSDFSTLFQDSAGSTPVTAVEQPVRLMRDRSGRGNDATAPNDASRPVLRARYNLLTFSEEFDNAAWTKFSTGGASAPTVSANTQAAPDGTTTADTVNLFSTAAASSVCSVVCAAPILLSANSFTLSVWLRGSVGGESLFLYGTPDAVTYARQSVTLTTSWVRYQLTLTGTAASWFLGFGCDRRDASQTAIADMTIYAWGAQLLTAADQTSTGGAYQRIAAATDYDTSNPVFRPYLAFDGSDDHLITASAVAITPTHSIVFAGNFNAPVSGANGDWVAFALAGVGVRARSGVYNASGTLRLRTVYNDGSTSFDNFSTGPQLFAGSQQVLSQVRRGATDLEIRRNGSVIASISSTTPTPLTDGRLVTGRHSVDDAQYYSGRYYGVLIFADTDAGSVTSAENWLNGKTGAY